MPIEITSEKEFLTELANLYTHFHTQLALPSEQTTALFVAGLELLRAERYREDRKQAALRPAGPPQPAFTQPAPQAPAQTPAPSQPHTNPAPPNGLQAPVCQQCNSAMVYRTGRRGPFWGCSTYPNCRHLVNIPQQQQPSGP